jgi:hypothetical protein
MTDANNIDDYFDESNRKGAPSAKLKAVGDFVQGEIVAAMQRPKTKFGTNDVELNDDGSERKQLVIILQTEYRNWDKVAKVPTAKDGSPRPAEDDEGLRAVYVPKYTNIYQALGDAIHEAGETKIAVRNGNQPGGWFGIKITELEDTGKGNPLKKHAAKYKAPEKAVEEDPFGEFEAPAAGKAVADDKTVNEPAPAKEEPKTETPVEEPPF